MRKGFRLAVGLGVLALTLAVLGLGPGAPVSPVERASARGLLTPDPPPPAAPPTISIQTPRKVFQAGEAANVRVKVRGLAEQPYFIDVYESAWPYEEERLMDTIETEGERTHDASWAVEPRFNTKYRAAIRGIPEATTKQAPVWVAALRAGVDLKWVNRRERRLRASMIFKYSRKLSYDFDGLPLYFYLRKVGSNRITPVGRTRTRMRRPGRVHGSVTFRTPPGKYRFYVPWCFQPDRADFGLGKPSDFKCPRRPVSTQHFGKLAAAPLPRGAAVGSAGENPGR